MEKHFKLCNPYNFIATLICKLRDKDVNAFKDSSQRNAMIIPDDLEDNVNSIFSKYDCLNNVEQILEDGIPLETEIKVLDYIEKTSFIYGFEFLLRFARKLKWDSIINSLYVKKLASHGGFIGLNTNGRELGIWIVPKIPAWDDTSVLINDDDKPNKKKWVTEWLAGINDDLANIYYVDATNLNIGEKYYIPNHIIINDVLDLTTRKFRIAFSPITNSDCLDPQFYNKNGKHLFACNRLKKSEHIKERIGKVYMEACRKKADILFFPEMLGIEDMSQKGSFDDIAIEAADLGFPSPTLIFTPTIWNNCSNKLYVVSGGGNTVCAQNKQNPFLFEKDGIEYLEDLCNSEPIVNILHIPYIGRLAMPICMDLLKTDYVKILVEVLRASMLICPSFSFGKALFNFESLAGIPYGCITIWGNSCKAGYKEDDEEHFSGLISAPLKSGEHTRKFIQKCKGVCLEQDDGCIFILDLSFEEDISIDINHICINS